MLHSHLHQRIFLPPWFFGFLHQQQKEDGGWALFTLSLCLPFKVALFLLIQYVQYYNLFIFSPQEQQLDMHLKEENLTEYHTIPIPEIHTKQSIHEENSSLVMNSIFQKGKMKVETSSLRNLKIMPRNLNEILLSWIPSLYSGSIPASADTVYY